MDTVCTGEAAERLLFNMNTTEIARFWKWFHQRASSLSSDPGKYGDEISEMIERLHTGLAWEMGGPNADGKLDFVVRCQNPKARSFCEEIVSRAPDLPGWIFSAWRPAHNTAGFQIRIADGRTYTADLFTADIAEVSHWPLLDLVLVSPEFRKDPTPQDRHAGYLVLDAALGEKMVEDALDDIQIRSGPPGKFRVSELREVVYRELALARTRSTSGTDRWISVEGERSGKPMLISLAETLGADRLANYPWLLVLSLPMWNPGENGLPTGEELDRLQVIGDRLIQELTDNAAGLFWGAWSHDGWRKCAFYMRTSIDLVDRARSITDQFGERPEIEVKYDSRWRAYRGFLPEG